MTGYESLQKNTPRSKDQQAYPKRHRCLRSQAVRNWAQLMHQEDTILLWLSFLQKTRKHSSRMHTSCLPTVQVLVSTTRCQYWWAMGIPGPLWTYPHSTPWTYQPPLDISPSHVPGHTPTPPPGHTNPSGHIPIPLPWTYPSPGHTPHTSGHTIPPQDIPTPC